MFVYLYISIYIYIPVCIHTYIHAHTHVLYIFIYVHTYIYTYICIYTYINVCVCARARIVLVLEKRAQMGERLRGRGSEGERIPSRLHAQSGARHRAWFHNPGIMTQAKIKNQMLNRLSHPGAPILFSNKSTVTKFF